MKKVALSEYSFNKYLLNTQYIPLTLLSTTDTRMNEYKRQKSLNPESLYSIGKKHTRNMDRKQKRGC